MSVELKLKRCRCKWEGFVGRSAGSSIGELREFPQLQGKLAIFKVQNVDDARDALQANLRDKKDLKELELAWCAEDADDSQKEKDVLDKLHPCMKIETLTIQFYGGTNFPNWLGDSSFSNLQVMHLSDCSYCWSLPPVGRLPSLKELCIERMKSVKMIGVEFYGRNGDSLIQPFQSLEKLKFMEMAEWEEWVPSASGGEYGPDFPRLQELILTKCPKLSRSLPCHLPCLKKLTVSGCEVLHDEGANTTTTRSLNYRSLEELEIEGGCQKGLLSLLVEIGNSVDIQCLPNRNCLQRLILRNCPMLSSFPKDGLPTTLTTLYIQNCKRLEFLPDEMLAKLTSLESLWIENSCDSLRNFSLSIFPKLKKLDIRGSENLESLSFIEGGVNENLSHLRELFIDDCPNLMCFQCQGGWPTPNLNDFAVGKCKNFMSLPEGIHTLTALRVLQVDDLPNLESFAEGGLPPNIRDLCIRSCERLRAPVVKYWGLEGLVSLEYFIIGGSILETLLKEHLLPTTLRSLVISGCHSILVLPGEGEGLRHLTSLQLLQIDACENLQFLPGEGLQHLTSLQELHITSCHSIQFLPEEGLPLSLSLLSIRNCSTLEKRYQNKTGKDWTKISHIPCIRVNGQVIII